MIQRSNANRKTHSGIAIVEFAVILPVFVCLLLGTIEACTMIFLRQSVEIAAYEAARVAIVPKTNTNDVNKSANNLLTARRVKNATISITPSDFQSAPYGTFIRIDVSVSCNDNAFVPLSFYGDRTITGTVEMMKEF